MSTHDKNLYQSAFDAITSVDNLRNTDISEVHEIVACLPHLVHTNMVTSYLDIPSGNVLIQAHTTNVSLPISIPNFIKLMGFGWDTVHDAMTANLENLLQSDLDSQANRAILAIAYRESYQNVGNATLASDTTNLEEFSIHFTKPTKDINYAMLNFRYGELFSAGQIIFVAQQSAITAISNSLRPILRELSKADEITPIQVQSIDDSPSNCLLHINGAYLKLAIPKLAMLQILHSYAQLSGATGDTRQTVH